MRKLICLVLVAAVLLAAAVPAGAAFSDITDQTTQQEVAVLQMMGVINGTSDTTFSPGGTLTRAQFCKMAVILMGRGDEEPLYRTRTIFPDVRSGHWARGYINLAVSIDIGADEEGAGGTKLIRGVGDGTFRPDRSITYAEAVTILLRLLGYSDADAGMNWPNGYLELAAKIGLTDGMGLGSGQSLTRAQAAHLFVTMLTTAQKSGSAYYHQLGSVHNNVVLMNGNAKAEDGTLGAMGTSEGTFKPASGVVPAELVGTRGTLVTNEAGKAAAFIPAGEHKSLTVGTAQAGWVTDQSGVKYEIPTEAPAYTTTESTTYDKLWVNLRAGSRITLFYSEAGKVDGVYMSTATADTAMVARTVGSGNPFASILDGASSYTIYRDGNPASVGDICLYDVGIYDPATRILSVSSAKLTGRYDNVWPNLESPSKVTVLGAELPVMPMAMEDMSDFRLGDTVTLLLTSDGQVAGAVSASDARGDNIGVLEKLEGNTAQVTLLTGGIRLEGNCTGSNVQAGELVRVGSSGANKLSLSRVSGSGASGSFQVAERKVGTVPLSGSCRLFEKVGKSAMKEISAEDLTRASIPGSQIVYAHRDTGGRIDLLILDNATGDLYTYGMLKNGTPQEVSGGEGTSYTNRTIIVTNSDHPDGTSPVVSNLAVSKNMMAGVVFTADGAGVAGTVSLTEESGIHRSDFTTRDGKTYVTLKTQEMRVSDDVQCYNRTTGTWFEDLTDARAFSDDLTIYYDRPVNEGGKVRVVVAE